VQPVQSDEAEPAVGTRQARTTLCAPYVLFVPERLRTLVVAGGKEQRQNEHPFHLR